MKFYGDACGWTFSDKINGEYNIAFLEGKAVAGIMDMTNMDGMDGVPPHWFTYLAVDDIDASVQGFRAAGAGIVREPFDIPQFGRLAIVSDPTGAVLGFIEPESAGEC